MSNEDGKTTWCTVDGVPIFARTWEPDAQRKAVVVLVHGMGEHIGRYEHVAAALNSTGYVLFGMDLRGHGRSGGRRGYIPHYLTVMDDITQLLAEAGRRFPELPQFLYGQSMGGSLVINYALRKLPKLVGVIATSPGLRPGFTPPAWKVLLGKIFYSLWPSFTMANGLDLTALSQDAGVMTRYKADALVHDRVTARLGVDILSTGEWAIEHADEFPLPLLLMHGSADRVTSASASQIFASSAGASCTFVLWEGLYHELHNESEQGEVFRTLISWLDRQLESAQAQ
jgi:alpha-beta hydrolase superfamily lysophospholipase